MKKIWRTSKRIIALLVFIIIMAIIYNIVIRYSKIFAQKQIEPKTSYEEIPHKMYLYKNSINKNIKQTIAKAEEEINKENEEKAKSEITIITEGDISQNDVKALRKEISNTIPEWLVENFIEDNWYIILTSKDIAKEYYNGEYKRVMAVTQHKNKRILIEKSSINECVAHEFGHFLDGTCTYSVSNSDEFKQIYKEEAEIFKSKLENDGCVFNESEFFAEEFYFSRKNPKICTKKALEYINKVSEYYKKGAHI